MRYIELGDIFNGESLPRLAWVCCTKPEQLHAMALAMAVEFKDPRTKDYTHISFTSLEYTDHLLEREFKPKYVYVVLCKNGVVTYEMAKELREKLVYTDSMLIMITPYLSRWGVERPDLLPDESLRSHYREPRVSEQIDYVAYAKMTSTAVELYIDKYRGTPADHPKQLSVPLLT